MPEVRLVPRLGLLDATALALGAMIGAGVFVALGQAAGTTGASLPLAILLAAAVAALNGLSAAQLGVAYPWAGGGYEFGYQVVSPAAGFAAGWLFALASITSSATYSLTFAGYLHPLLPGLSPRILGLVLVLAAIVANLLGVSLSARVNRALVFFKIAVLLLFVVVGATAFEPRNLTPWLISGPSGLLQATALVFFSFTGYARPVTVVEEVRAPRATLPRAIAMAVGITLVLYLAVALVAMGLMGPVELGRSPAPLRDAISSVGGLVGAGIISIGAVLVMASVILTELWGLSRLAFAMSRRGDLPAVLRQLGPGNVPRNAVLATGVAILVLSATVDLRPALEASSLALLLYYAFINLAALRMDPRQRLYPPVVSAAGLVACLALAITLPWTTLLAVGAALGVGLAYFLLTRR